VPADLEEIVDALPGIRYSAAIGLDHERTGTQRLHIVAEVRGESLAADGFSRLARDIAATIHRQRGFRPARILLVRPQSIPKTSSGKIQRSALAALVAEGRLSDRIVHATGAVGREPAGA